MSRTGRLGARPHKAKPRGHPAPFSQPSGRIHISRDRSDKGQSSGLPMTTNFGSMTCCRLVLRRLVIMGMSLSAFSLVWLGGYDAYWPPDSQREAPIARPAIDTVVERIIGVETNGDPNAKNKRSSATGLGQFLDETWLDISARTDPIWLRSAANRKS